MPRGSAGGRVDSSGLSKYGRDSLRDGLGENIGGGFFDNLPGLDMLGGLPSLQSDARSGASSYSGAVYSTMNSPFVVGGGPQGVSGAVQSALPLLLVGGVAWLALK